MKNLSLRQTLLTILLILSPLILSLLPFFIPSYMSPPDRVFMGLHRWSEDYYGYLQSINQGLMGHITNVSKLTLEPHQPTFVHSEYVLLGFISRFFGLNSALTYHLARLVLGAIFIFVAFYFFYFLSSLSLRGVSRSGTTKQSSSSNKEIATATSWPRNDRLGITLISFFLAFFVGGFPHITSWQPLHIEPYLSWWSELDVLTRSTILPHYLMGNILFLLVIILFIKFISLYAIKTINPNRIMGQKRVSLKSYFLLLISGFLLAFVHPIDFLILLCTLGLFIILQTIFYVINRIPYTVYRILPSLLIIGIIFVSGLIPALYYRYALSLPFWRFILAHGTTTQYNIPLFDLSMALGPTFFLAIGGIILFLLSFFLCHSRFPLGHELEAEWRGNDNIGLLLFSWLFVQALFFLKLYEVFDFDRLRTMQAPYYLPLAFFAASFIFPWQKTKQYLFYLILFLLILPTILTTLIFYQRQIFSVSSFKTFSLFSYPTIKQYQAWQFLRDHTPDNNVITALYEAKFLIPTVSGNKIAFGANFDNNPNYNENVNKINKFYQGTFSPQDTYNFFLNNSISYVYWGYQEQSLGGDLTKYLFLQKIFANGEVTIFKVK